MCGIIPSRKLRISGLALAAMFGWMAVVSVMSGGCSCRDQTLLPAFPGAEGFGAYTPGGRGGKVMLVTTLEDYLEGKEPPIAGSFRSAVTAEGPRMVVFRVSGTIKLKGPIDIRNPYLTIAGQTAPGDGICLRDYPVGLETHDLIIRHMRIRSGDSARQEQVTVDVVGGKDFILDHCSLTWSTDENYSSFGSSYNITVQWCVISEGLRRSYHPKGQHSNGSILGGDGGMTFHHNIYAHNASRNPKIDDMVMLDFRNNVIYDWGYRCAYTSNEPCYVNYVNNYFKTGPSTRENSRANILNPGDDSPRIFLSGNVLADNPDLTQDNRLMIWVSSDTDADSLRQTVVVAEPFAAPAVRTESVEIALESVLAGCGATLPRRDSADKRLMEEIRAGTGRIIDSQNDVGGWPVLNSATAPEDTDCDGMPDAWERQHNLDPHDSADNNGDADGDGYTNIEEYINNTDPRAAEGGCRVNAADSIRLREQAIALCAGGNSFEAQRQAQKNAQWQARKNEIINTLKVAIEPREGPAVKKIVVNLGGKADMEMVLIPAGSFLMGSPQSEDGEEIERPQHKVNISRAYYMAATPITIAQLAAVMGDPADGEKDANLPAAVNWFRGMEFCQMLSAITGRTLRLPTEAEWEYACRAGTTTAFNTGETITTEQANFDGTEAGRYNQAGVNRGEMIPPRMLPPNAWGLYGMHGNELEYCLDSWLRTYTAGEVTDPVHLRTSSAQQAAAILDARISLAEFTEAMDQPATNPLSGRIVRGGRATSKAVFLRSAYRYRYAPFIKYSVRPVMEMIK